MTTQTIPAATTLLAPPTVTLEQDDTCDICGPAVIANTAILTKRGKKLAFCNHCYNTNEAGLAVVIAAVVRREVK